MDSHGNQLACQHILFTPLDETFSFPIPDGMAFHGTADPWADTARLTNLARQKNVPPGAGLSVDVAAIWDTVKTDPMLGGMTNAISRNRSH